MKYFALALLLLAVACDQSGSSSGGESPVDQFVTDDDAVGDEKGDGDVDVDVSTLDAVTTEYMKLLNDYRREQGLETLIYSSVIATSAAGHSANMANKTITFGHTGSSGRCSSIQKSLGGGNLCGEIVAMGQKTAKDVFAAWKNSAGHNSIMTNGRYTHTGLGFVKNSSGTIYWTQIFLEL